MELEPKEVIRLEDMEGLSLHKPSSFEIGYASLVVYMINEAIEENDERFLFTEDSNLPRFLEFLHTDLDKMRSLIKTRMKDAQHETNRTDIPVNRDIIDPEQS